MRNLLWQTSDWNLEPSGSIMCCLIALTKDTFVVKTVILFRKHMYIKMVLLTKLSISSQLWCCMVCPRTGELLDYIWPSIMYSVHEAFRLQDWFEVSDFEGKSSDMHLAVFFVTSLVNVCHYQFTEVTCKLKKLKSTFVGVISLQTVKYDFSYHITWFSYKSCEKYVFQSQRGKYE